MSFVSNKIWQIQTSEYPHIATGTTSKANKDKTMYLLRIIKTIASMSQEYPLHLRRFPSENDSLPTFKKKNRIAFLTNQTVRKTHHENLPHPLRAKRQLSCFPSDANVPTLQNEGNTSARSNFATQIFGGTNPATNLAENATLECFHNICDRQPLEQRLKTLVVS